MKNKTIYDVDIISHIRYIGIEIKRKGNMELVNERKLVYKINEFFLGSDATASDYIWFYGFYVITLLITIITIGGIV